MRRGVARQRKAVVLLLVFAVVAIFFYYRKTQQMTQLSEVRGETYSGNTYQLDNVRDTVQKQETAQPHEVYRPIPTQSTDQPNIGRKLDISQTTVSRDYIQNAITENDNIHELTLAVKHSTLVPEHLDKRTSTTTEEFALIAASKTRVVNEERSAVDSIRKFATDAPNVAKEDIVILENLYSSEIIAENSVVPAVTPVQTVHRSVPSVTQRLSTVNIPKLDYNVNNDAAITVQKPYEVNVQQSTAIDKGGPIESVITQRTTTTATTTSTTKHTENPSSVVAHESIVKTTQEPSTHRSPSVALPNIDRQSVQTPAVVVEIKSTATAKYDDAATKGGLIHDPSNSHEPSQVVADFKRTTTRVQAFTISLFQKPHPQPVDEVKTNDTIRKPDTVINVTPVLQNVQRLSVTPELKVDEVALDGMVNSATTVREGRTSTAPGKYNTTPRRTRPHPDRTTSSFKSTPAISDPQQRLFDVTRSQLTSGRLSTMELINPKDVYEIGDEVVVRVKTRNQLNRPKRRGGDYLKARMFTDVVAASTPGEIKDHENGTYTIRFRAGWSGSAAVQVHVIHPREAIDVLRRLRDVERKRVNACSFVQDGSTEWTRCWTTPSRDPEEQECDFSHAPSGTDWYCKKPVRAPCSAIDKCSGGGLRPLEEIGVTETDKMLFNETFIDQAVMEGTILWVQVTEQDVPCVIRHGSGNCLYASDPDVDGSAPLRRRVVLWPCTDSVRQVFVLRHDGKIIHLYSGLCVGVINDNSTDHGQIVLRKCESGGLRFRRTESRAIQDVTTLRCLHPHLDVQVPLDGSPVRLAEGCKGATVVFEFMEDLSDLPKCEPGHPPSAGFYLHDNWYTYACRARQFPDRDSVIKCLTNKSVYMYGDSTVRQWFDHLNSYLGLTRLTLLPGMENCHIGPCGSHHNSTNTHLHMMFHNFPIYGNPFKYHRMIYIADELDRLQGGPDVVVVITIWFHFLMEPVHIYRKRIVAIRDAILRLHQRHPETLVLIKSSNMAFSSLWAPTHVGNYLMADDWMAQDLDRLQRDVFSPTRAVFLDVWGMTACHRLQHDIHPPGVIVAAEVRLMLAYICPT